MKEMKFNDEARISLKKGIDKLADAVAVTLGPMGKNVIIGNKYETPQATKDGVTVAKSIKLSDKFENIGAQIIKTVASKTCDDAGDGTTTSTVLTQAIISEGLKRIQFGCNSVELKKGIDKAVEYVVSGIKSISKKVEDNNDMIRFVATVSANNDKEIGNIVAEAMIKGNGTVMVEDSLGNDTYVETIIGSKFNRGYMSKYFITDTEHSTTEFVNPLIVTTKEKVNTINEILPYLNSANSKNLPILFIVSDIDEGVMSTLITNKLKGALSVCVVKAPFTGKNQKEAIEDLSILCNGSAEKVIVSRDSTIIVNGRGANTDEFKKRKEDVDSSATGTIDSERMSMLNGIVSVIKVGGQSEMEIKEKKDRIDDAISAVRSSMEEGVVPGGGVAYIMARKSISLLKLDKNISYDEKIGIEIIYDSLLAPIDRIISNAGKNSAVYVDRISKQKNVFFGYNVKEDRYEDFLISGILDPAKVSRVAIENAASVASLILTTECVITEDDEIL